MSKQIAVRLPDELVLTRELVRRIGLLLDSREPALTDAIRAAFDLD
ncbi:hypothetical protein [Conexibacter woesei]|uniref:Uncharacterized protein n=1 Tax=Conexibacter woesei (strain DSM 14684 / CCUG 47730 / CIP 108061 / JCM 11494 / NBRC 100937 / ID131577) TaxID=469383 RepID=D3F8G3_CONWI|nr:hypothetical protein [Conexibacter woesei]ADB49033.1 hypothetical protein Cwoe_0598 [Conexibacter woesei DSM 14684]